MLVSIDHGDLKIKQSIQNAYYKLIYFKKENVHEKTKKNQ